MVHFASPLFGDFLIQSLVRGELSFQPGISLFPVEFRGGVLGEEGSLSGRIGKFGRKVKDDLLFDRLVGTDFSRTEFLESVENAFHQFFRRRRSGGDPN
jgi:hypothetical protein